MFLSRRVSGYQPDEGVIRFGYQTDDDGDVIVVETGNADAGIGDKVFICTDAAGVALSTINARTFAANILATADAVDAKIAADIAA